MFKSEKRRSRINWKIMELGVVLGILVVDNRHGIFTGVEPDQFPGTYRAGHLHFGRRQKSDFCLFRGPSGPLL